MGNKDSKQEDQSTVKTKKLFKQLAQNDDKLQKKVLEGKWSGSVDERLLKMLMNELFSSGSGLDFQGFNQFALIMLDGNYNDKAEIIVHLVSNQNASQYEQLKMFITGLLMSLVKIEQKKNRKSFKSWDFTTTPSFDRFSEYCVTLAGGIKPQYSNQDIRSVITAIPRFLDEVFNDLLNVNANNSSSPFPHWVRNRMDGGKKIEQSSLLKLEDILFLNNELPIDWQAEWRLLFSTNIHGESFARLLGQIVNQGPTLLIIKDTNNHIFGGFAPASWTLNPKYVGDSSCFLFSLSPEMTIFPASNFNENYQYLNQGQQTLPNGLGMGGCLEYFGLWLDSEFGKGISNDSCTTFRQFKRLSKEKEFTCEDVEVWGVGSPPLTAEELGERSSVLDKNAEAKAFLEMAGKKTYSDGLREDPKD